MAKGAEDVAHGIREAARSLMLRCSTVLGVPLRGGVLGRHDRHRSPRRFRPGNSALEVPGWRRSEIYDGANNPDDSQGHGQRKETEASGDYDLHMVRQGRGCQRSCRRNSADRTLYHEGRRSAVLADELRLELSEQLGARAVRADGPSIEGCCGSGILVQDETYRRDRGYPDSGDNAQEAARRLTG